MRRLKKQLLELSNEYDALVEDVNNYVKETANHFTIKDIHVNIPKANVSVIFADGSKRRVHLEKGDKFDVYNAVAYAYALQHFESNSKFQKETEKHIHLH